MPGDREFRIALRAGVAKVLRESTCKDPAIRRWQKRLEGNVLVLTSRDIRALVADHLAFFEGRYDSRGRPIR